MINGVGAARDVLREAILDATECEEFPGGGLGAPRDRLSPWPGGGLLVVRPGVPDLGSGEYGLIVIAAQRAPVRWPARSSATEVALSSSGGRLMRGQSARLGVAVRSAGPGSPPPSPSPGPSPSGSGSQRARDHP